MTILDNLISAYRVNASTYEDEHGIGADGVNTGSPTTSTGAGAEDFLEFNGTSQSTNIAIPSYDLFDTDYSIAVRFKTGTVPSTTAVIAGLGNSADNDQALVVRGSGTDALSAWLRNDDTGVIATATTNTDTDLFNNAERIAVITYTTSTGTLTIDELTLGLSGSTSLAEAGTATFDSLGLGNWPRPSPTYLSDSDASWVATWDRALVAQDLTDLNAAVWPFVAAPNPILTDTLLDADSANAPLIDETGLTVHVYDTDGGTLLYTTAAATTDGSGVFTIDDDLVGAVDDTVFVIIKPASGRPVCGTMTVTDGNA